ncbi:MAG: hypothetical protein KDI36_16680 [Pseudomonadales bacterium]|nr:hypothetical protein [Pseudomonadales bacterium]
MPESATHTYGLHQLVIDKVNLTDMNKPRIQNLLNTAVMFLLWSLPWATLQAGDIWTAHSAATELPRSADDPPDIYRAGGLTSVRPVPASHTGKPALALVNCHSHRMSTELLVLRFHHYGQRDLDAVEDLRRKAAGCQGAESADN